MGVVANERGELLIHLLESSPADRYVPSVDRLFQTVADQCRLPVLALVLTGMGADGSQGIQPLRRQGAVTLAESQESSIVFGMPKEAIQTGCIDEVLALDGLIERVMRFSAGRD